MPATTNLSVLTLCDVATGLVGASGALDNQVNIQGLNCWFYQTPKNGIGDGNFTPATAVDMSGADNHLYWWMRCDVMPFCELLNTGAVSSGLMVKVESSATDYKTFHMAGRDTWGGEWRAFILDYNRTTEIFETVGTLDLTAVTKISFLTDNSNSGTIRIVDNTMLDAIRFGVGTITVTGTDVNYKTAADEDNLPANKWGIASYKNGVITLQGRIIADDNAGTTTFNSTNEKIAFADDAVSAGLYKLDFTGTGLTAVIQGLNVFSSGLLTNTRPTFTSAGTVGSFTMSGANFDRCKLITHKAGQSITATVFNDCYQIDPSTATFKNITASNYVGTTGAVLFPTDGTNITDINFINCDNGVEYDAASDPTNPTFVNFIFDDEAGNFDVNNTSGGAITIILSGTSNANSSQGSAVTFSNPKIFSFTVSPSITGYEWRIYTVTALGSLAGSVEVAGEESAIQDNQSYNYTYAGDEFIAVQIIAQPDEDFKEEIQYFTLISTDQDVTINLDPDTNN